MNKYEALTGTFKVFDEIIDDFNEAARKVVRVFPSSDTDINKANRYISHLKNMLRNKEQENAELSRKLKKELVAWKRLQLEFKVCVCDCGEKWEGTDADILVDEHIEKLSKIIKVKN